MISKVDYNILAQLGCVCIEQVTCKGRCLNTCQTQRRDSPWSFHAS